ncbi:MAG: DNA-3-methyladenine glycosylase I [Thermoanaerobaculia bacterium]|nr:DNA-3-methyladenine glycosylase I [Thermoanaerobaculia bacterium]
MRESHGTHQVRCGWAGDDPVMVAYHDEEWGVPIRDDRHLFELLVLEGAQAGLSWSTVLNKRPRYREVFAGFDPAAVAAFGEAEKHRLLADPGIIRNRSKIDAAIGNARVFLRVQEEMGSFADHLWSFVGGRPKINRWRRLSELPASTPESEALSRDLKRRGFRFVGPTICYAYMQSAGLVNDHEVGCFRYGQLGGRAG